MKIKTLNKLIIIIFLNTLILFVVTYLLNKTISENYQHKFLLSTLIRVLLLIPLIVIILKDKIFNIKIGLFNNNRFWILVCIIVLLFSYFNTFSLINQQNLAVSNYKQITYFFKYLIGGFYEEFLIRIIVFGFIYKIMNYKNLFISIVLASLIFSFIHLVNLISPDYNILGVINQMLLTLILGIIFQFIFIKTSNILTVVTLHALFNYFSTRDSTLFEKEILIPNDIQGDEYTATIVVFIFTISVILPLTFLYSKDLNVNLVSKNIE